MTKRTIPSSQLPGQVSGVVIASIINYRISAGLEVTTFAIFMVLVMSLTIRKILHGLRHFLYLDRTFFFSFLIISLFMIIILEPLLPFL